VSARVEKRFAVVGSLHAARFFLDVLPEFPELLLDAVVSPQAHEPGFTPRVRRFQSLDDLIRYRALPDVALLCTPPGDHLEAGLSLLRVGADLVVLPPLATRFEDAERLLEFAERAGRELTTAIPSRLSPALLGARVELDSGRLGSLHYVGVSLSDMCDPRASGRSDPERSGGGVWMQLGPQALDIVELLAGPVERVRMLESHSKQGAGVEDEVRVECDHGAGRRSRIALSWNERWTDPIAHCVGDDAELLVGDSQTIVRRNGRDRRCGPGYDPRDACRALLSEHLRRRCSLEPPIDTGPETVAWLESAYHTLGTERWGDVG
jgi:predicted dehydrogenase